MSRPLNKDRLRELEEAHLLEEGSSGLLSKYHISSTRLALGFMDNHNYCSGLQCGPEVELANILAQRPLPGRPEGSRTRNKQSRADGQDTAGPAQRSQSEPMTGRKRARIAVQDADHDTAFHYGDPHNLPLPLPLCPADAVVTSCAGLGDNSWTDELDAILVQTPNRGEQSADRIVVTHPVIGHLPRSSVDDSGTPFFLSANAEPSNGVREEPPCGHQGCSAYCMFEVC